MVAYIGPLGHKSALDHSYSGFKSSGFYQFSFARISRLSTIKPSGQLVNRGARPAKNRWKIHSLFGENRMCQRTVAWVSGLAGLGTVLGIVGYLVVWYPADPPLRPAPVGEPTHRIIVDRPAQVSKANEDIPHQECVAAADPGNPARLLVAAIYSSEKWGKTAVNGRTIPTRGVAGYYSADGGETWQLAFEHKGDPENSFIDPALAFGPAGSAHFVCMRLRMKAHQGRSVFVGDPEAGCLEFSRSSDGGKTWGPTAAIPPHIDRPWITVDCTMGPYRGRLYCLGNLAMTWDLFTFPDVDPAKAAKKVSVTKKPGMSFNQSTNLAFLSDGAVVFAHDSRSGDKTRRPVTAVYLSRDGGQTFAEVGRVNTAWADPRRFTINRLFFPQLGADTRSTAYRD